MGGSGANDSTLQAKGRRGRRRSRRRRRRREGVKKGKRNHLFACCYLFASKSCGSLRVVFVFGFCFGRGAPLVLYCWGRLTLMCILSIGYGWIGFSFLEGALFAPAAQQASALQRKMQTNQKTGTEHGQLCIYRSRAGKGSSQNAIPCPSRWRKRGRADEEVVSLCEEG